MKKFLLVLTLLLLAVDAFAGDPIVETVSYSPAPAIPGQAFNMFVHVKNNSKYMSEDVQFELDLSGGRERDTPYPFSLGTGVSSQKIISTIKPYKTALVEFRVEVDPSALDGTYTVVFRYSEAGAQKEYPYIIKIESRRPDLEIVRTSQIEVSPGQVAEFTLTVRNIGNSEAMDVLVGLTEDRTVTATGVVVEREFSALGASFDFIENLGAGRERNATITLAVNPEAEQKTYTLPITINFKDANAVEYSITSYIGVQVIQDPELDAVVSDVMPPAYPGGKSEVTIDLFNIGIGTAKYVVAELETDAGTIIQEKTFIGTLEADDFDSFKITVKLRPDLDISEEQTINMRLTYKNQYGEQKEFEKTLVLPVNSAAAQAGMDPVGIAIGLIATVLQLLGLFVAGKWGYRKFVKKA